MKVQIPINFELDVVFPQQPVKSNGKILFYKNKETNKEFIVYGWMVVVTLNGEQIECTSFKNGKKGCADIINEKKSCTELIHGNVKAYLNIPYTKKIPKIELFLVEKTLA